MQPVIQKAMLFAALSINLILASCGGGGETKGASGEFVSINGVKYTANGSTVYVDATVDQINPFGYLYGGQAAIITMVDSQSGNLLVFQLLSTADGWPGTYNVLGVGAYTTANITDKSVATGGDMVVAGMGTGTGGTIKINSFGSVGQPITGSFNINMCDSQACSAGVKNYTGDFNINRTESLGSLTKPVSLMMPNPTSNTYEFGINPATGKNYFIIPTNATGGTLTITLTPTVDVNMAVFSDAGFATPAICNVTSILNVTGTGTETCSISVAAKQKIYVTVSQPASATAQENFTLSESE